MKQSCECRTETHGHKAGECGHPATEPDRICKTCSEKKAAEAMGEMLAPPELKIVPEHPSRGRLPEHVRTTEGIIEPPKT